MSHPDLPAEQAYVDHAYECLDRMAEVVSRAGDAAHGEVVQAALDAWSAQRLQTLSDAQRGLCFGRLDFEAIEQPLYVGRRREKSFRRYQIRRMPSLRLVSHQRHGARRSSDAHTRICRNFAC